MSVDAREWSRRIAAAVPARALWVGWSMGGLVALHRALDAPETVRGLVEIAESPRLVAAPDWPHGVAADVLAEFGAGLQRNYRRAIERFLALELIGSANAQSMLRDLKAHVFERGEPPMRVLVDGLRVLETTDLRARIRELRMPSLWIAGRRDRLISAAAMRWSAQQATDGSYIEIDSGHAPFLSHAQEVADAIVAFAAEDVRMTPPLDPRQVRRAFGRAAASYGAHAVLQHEVEQRLVERLDYFTTVPARVLDIGCGPGRAALAMRDRWKPAQVIALDLAMPMLRLIRPGWLRPLTRVNADARALPLADASVDVVFSNLACSGSTTCRRCSTKSGACCGPVAISRSRRSDPTRCTNCAPHGARSIARRMSAASPTSRASATRSCRRDFATRCSTPNISR